MTRLFRIESVFERIPLHGTEHLDVPIRWFVKRHQALDWEAYIPAGGRGMDAQEKALARICLGECFTESEAEEFGRFLAGTLGEEAYELTEVTGRDLHELATGKAQPFEGMVFGGLTELMSEGLPAWVRGFIDARGCERVDDAEASGERLIIGGDPWNG